MAEKLFYTMGEVAELFDVNPSLLRYWEEQFPKLEIGVEVHLTVAERY